MVEVATLVERCRSGDELAWEALVRRYQSRVYGLAFHYLRNAEEARDAAQEIFIRVYRRLDRFRDGSSFEPWLMRLARNACIDRLRRNKARRDREPLPEDAEGRLEEEGRAPDEHAFADEQQQLVYRAMGRLSDRNREIILLKEIQGLNFNEIAEMLSVPVGTVKSRSHRARAELARAVLVLDPSYGS